jgi:putative PIN family toxin of toxin-antitoxin system
VISSTADTNIYVSALAIGGKPIELLRLANAGKIELAVSDAILDEIATVLARPKFGWSAERIQDARQAIRKLARHVTPTERVEAVKDDPTDNIILECAQAAGSDYIVSGDKHLLRLKQFGNAPILKISDFLETVLGQSGKVI